MVACLVLAYAIAPIYSHEQLSLLNSGPEIGTAVGSFYVRAITGPFAGKSVCYVCRNGDRPVVMVFVRELGPDITKLLKELDVLVNQHRADGLRCFVVMLTEASQKDSARLQTLAFDEKLDLPLTVANESSARTPFTNISTEAAVSVILYDHMKVVDQFSYRTGECSDTDRKSIVTSAERLTKEPSL